MSSKILVYTRIKIRDIITELDAKKWSNRWPKLSILCNCVVLRTEILGQKMLSLTKTSTSK